MDIEELLEEEIASELVRVKTLKLGSEEYKIAINTLSQLLDRSAELKKIRLEHEAKAAQSEADRNAKHDQMREDRKARRVRATIDFLAIAIPTAATVWGAITSMKFETTDNFTTIMGRGFINNLVPKKK